MKLRTILKIATVTSVMLLCMGFAISFYFRMSVTERAEDFDLYTLVPLDSKVIVDTDNMVDLMQLINELNCSKDQHFLYFSRLFSYLKEHINTLLEDTPHGLSKQMNKMLISFHEPNNDRNQVFYCRLGAGDYEFIEQFIQKYFVNSFPARFFDYRGEEIRIYPMSDDTFLACYVTSEFLVVSYQKKLIEQVIDARLAKNSILTDKTFGKIRSERRMVAPAVIYARMLSVDMGKNNDTLRIQSNLGNWTEYNVNLNGEAIYLAGVNYDADTCVTFVNALRHQEVITSFPGDILPASTFFFTTGSMSDLDQVLTFTSNHSYTKAAHSEAIMAGDEIMYHFLKDYADKIVTTCMFHNEDTLATAPHVVIHVPIRNKVEIKQVLKSIYHLASHQSGFSEKFGDTYFTTSMAYFCCPLPRNTLFAQIAGIADSAMVTYACVYDNHLLVSPHIASLKAYVQLMEENRTLLKESVWFENITLALSQNYNFLMMADMDELLEQSESCIRFMPNLFFRHSDFFRHFILTTQFTCIDNVVYPSLSLAYKGKDNEFINIPDEQLPDSTGRDQE